MKLNQIDSRPSELSNQGVDRILKIGRTGSPSAPQLRGMSGVWQSIVDRLIPVGYEDEAGFHLGTRRIQVKDRTAS